MLVAVQSHPVTSMRVTAMVTKNVKETWFVETTIVAKDFYRSMYKQNLLNISCYRNYCNTKTLNTMHQKISKCEVQAWLCWNLIILPPLRFCVKSHYGEFKRSKNVIHGNFRDVELWILVNFGLESCSDLLKIKIENL